MDPIIYDCTIYIYTHNTSIIVTVINKTYQNSTESVIIFYKGGGAVRVLKGTCYLIRSGKTIANCSILLYKLYKIIIIFFICIDNCLNYRQISACKK